MNDEDTQQARFADLVAVSELQGRAFAAFAHAETAKRGHDDTAALTAYRAYLEAADEHLQSTLQFNARHPDSPFALPPVAQPLVNALLVAADLEQGAGDALRAQALRDRALALSREHLGHSGSVESARSLAGTLTLQGRFTEAIAALYEARDLALSGGDAELLARVALDLADVLHWLGDLTRAREEVDHAHAIVQAQLGGAAIGMTDVLGGMLESMAGIFSGRGDPGTGLRRMQLYRASVEVNFFRGLLAKAQQRWDEAEACFGAVAKDYGEMGVAESIEFQQAQVQAGRGEPAPALARLQAIAPVFERLPYRPKRAVLQRVMAEALLALGRPAEAEPLLRAALDDLLTRHADPDALWRTQAQLAALRQAKGNAAGALQASSDALQTVRRLRMAPLGWRLDSTFLADKRTLFASAIARALDVGDAAACAAFIDDLKARTLAAVLGQPDAAADAGTSEAARFDALARELDAIEYARYRDGPGDAAAAAEAAARRDDLLRERTALLERLRITDPRWRALSAPAALDLPALQQALGARGAAALTLHLGGDTLTAVLVTGSGCTAARQPLGAPLREALRDHADNLVRARPDVFRHDFSAEYGIDAGELVPPALLEAALRAQALFVVPHGVLHLLPWAMLRHQGRRLFELTPVALAPSLAWLAGALSGARSCALSGAAAAPTPTPTPTPRGVALLGVARYAALPALGDLPSTAQELDDIAALYRAGGCTVLGPLRDAEATTAAWERLLAVAPGGTVLHLSCHGTVVPQEPMHGGLLLADAKLDAAEIARRPLPAEEVVLSACSTGWRPDAVAGQVLEADEVLGLPGAFLEAGARTVLVSVPKAEGSSARALVTAYHRARLAGHAPLPAWQAAQRELLAAGTAPALWAGFALYGGL